MGVATEEFTCDNAWQCVAQTGRGIKGTHDDIFPRQCLATGAGLVASLVAEQQFLQSLRGPICIEAMCPGYWFSL